MYDSEGALMAFNVESADHDHGSSVESSERRKYPRHPLLTIITGPLSNLIP